MALRHAIFIKRGWERKSTFLESGQTRESRLDRYQPLSVLSDPSTDQNIRYCIFFLWNVTEGISWPAIFLIHFIFILLMTSKTETVGSILKQGMAAGRLIYFNFFKDPPIKPPCNFFENCPFVKKLQNVEVCSTVTGTISKNRALIRHKGVRCRSRHAISANSQLQPKHWHIWVVGTFRFQNMPLIFALAS